MFNYNNLKYRYLVDMLELSKLKNALYDDFSANSFFTEFNIICIGGVRQSGKTTSMKKVFDVNKDIYISPRLRINEEFLSNTYDLNSRIPVFQWDAELLNTIKNRDASLAMNMNNLDRRLSRALRKDSIIFLDVFSVEIQDNYKHVDQIIKILYTLSGQGMIDISKIKLVYT